MGVIVTGFLVLVGCFVLGCFIVARILAGRVRRDMRARGMDYDVNWRGDPNIQGHHSRSGHQGGFLGGLGGHHHGGGGGDGGGHHGGSGHHG